MKGLARIGKIERIVKDWQDNFLTNSFFMKSPDRVPPEEDIMDIGTKILLLENCSLGSSKAHTILGYYIFI